MTQLIIILALVGLAGFAIWKIWQGGGFSFKRKPKNACPKCDGLGYWEGLRQREKCDLCNGTGILPKK